MDRKPSIILTSAHAITRQWVDDIARMHPGWMIITDRGDTSDNIKVLKKKKKDDWVDNWPPMLQWVWSKLIDDEGNNPRRVILIMTYRSWARKTLMTKEENDKVTYSSSFASQRRDFEVLICDEAHRLKEVLLLTATPCLNDPRDYLELTGIIWTCRHQILDQEERDFLLELEKKGYGQFANTVKSFCQDENTHRTLRSLASKPEIVKALIHNSSEKQNWEAGFHHFSSVAILRRSASSTIFRMKGKEHPVSLTSVLPQLRPSSVSIDFETELKSKIEYSMLHLYTELILDHEQWLKRNGPQSKIPPPTSSHYWGLEQVASSWPGINLTDLSPLVMETYDPRPVTAYQLLFLAVRGSPQIQELLSLLCNKVLRPVEGNGNMTKVLVTLQNPFLAFYTEQVLKLLRVPTAVRYGNMDPETDIEVIRSFRSQEPGSVQVLLQPYTCGREGINLDGPCQFVFVMEPAYSGPIEDQTTARVHRTSTEHSLTVIRCFTTNSFHEDKLYKQLRKRVSDLCARFSKEQSASYMQAIKFIYPETAAMASPHFAKHLKKSHSVSLLPASDDKKHRRSSDDQLPEPKKVKNRITIADSERSSTPSTMHTSNRDDDEIPEEDDNLNLHRHRRFARSSNIHNLMDKKEINEEAIVADLKIRDIGYEAVHAVRTGLPFGGWHPTPKSDFNQERLDWQRSIIETALKSVEHMARRKHHDRQPQLSRESSYTGSSSKVYPERTSIDR
ncbi:hypothetical protein CSIM01_03015 [Colletotrichum simmondsii]|uniref:Helicase ATP-binding domain-containing protein n=1 Tax=Colletotrichum simmondsii TaxID=703756 RepID=A0A135SL56_9PEZI|nr:hypothetical protein CSIM01_03015 [Colletotrichum simmondsii]